MANFTIKIEKEDIKTSEIGNNIMVNCENNISIVFTREALEELINDYNDIKKDEAVIKVIDNIISETTPKENIKKDFATKEQREVFLNIMSKIVETKKLDKYQDSVFYMVDDLIYMEQDLKTNIFYIRCNGFWDVFESKFNINYQEIKEILRDLLEECLKCNVNATTLLMYIVPEELEECLKCNVNATHHYPIYIYHQLEEHLNGR